MYLEDEQIIKLALMKIKQNLQEIEKIERQLKGGLRDQEKKEKEKIK